ncbi:thioesterase-like superfamily-domain-containing protein [Clohesyomyces aquaticus]|uniref:Thioesterase-like superfamily-domain-containing protein n=1 Tax=Clohesyomyces aquaticus TaxID=1231657 RepID=A0A1Y1ZRJ6_9PLEO|nr:thioesterase-like superfamily-domain-containing protein [Clohesyomyces aquaticus]
MAPPSSFAEALAFKPTSGGGHKFETAHPPEKMGNAANIAYGGFALAAAVKGAYLSLPESPRYHLYSIVGNFLGPAFTDRPLRCTTKTVRQTRTFATRLVEVSQTQDNGQERACLIALADFQVKEAPMLEYSAPPSTQYSSYHNLPELRVHRQTMVETGKIPQALADAHEKSFNVQARLFEVRLCPEGISSQNLLGMIKGVETTQDKLPLTEKSTAEWARCRTALPTPADQAACLAFYMDGAISFAPLTFSKRWLDDSAACSSLDFALRVFQSGVRMEEWHFKELKTKVGAEGRTYGEAVLWDENGRAVASMTQQSILRPRKGERAVKL